MDINKINNIIPTEAISVGLIKNECFGRVLSNTEVQLSSHTFTLNYVGENN